jgi:hypothetical protein
MKFLIFGRFLRVLPTWAELGPSVRDRLKGNGTRSVEWCQPHPHMFFRVVPFLRPENFALASYSRFAIGICKFWNAIPVVTLYILRLAM